ncbi:hypothetical protein AcV5_008936 [Taiwanofungus camphoratus]|nr:hypothetical protein AcV5_008936 [Antrodia cinnamomea]
MPQQNPVSNINHIRSQVIKLTGWLSMGPYVVSSCSYNVSPSSLMSESLLSRELRMTLCFRCRTTQAYHPITRYSHISFLTWAPLGSLSPNVWQTFSITFYNYETATCLACRSTELHEHRSDTMQGTAHVAIRQL